MTPTLGSDVSSVAGAEIGQGRVREDLERQDRRSKQEPINRPRRSPWFQAGDVAGAAGHGNTCEVFISLECSTCHQPISTSNYRNHARRAKKSAGVSASTVNSTGAPSKSGTLVYLLS